VNRRGFTLLEVVVAMAILGLSLLAIFDLNAGAVNSHAYAKRITVATMLARSKMTDLEQELYDKGFDVDDQERSGDFRNEGWQAFTWKAQILAPRTSTISPDKFIEAVFNVPAGAGGGLEGLAALFTGGRDAGIPKLPPSSGPTYGPLPPGASGPTGLSALGPFATLAQTQITQLLDQIQKGVREVHLTVSWQEGRRTESVDLVTHFVSLKQGSDRNGTPGAALSSQTTPGGIPTIPELPGSTPGGVPGVGAQPGSGLFKGTGFFPAGTPLDPSGRPIRQQ
jgi:general secretion pathway protein I